MYYELKENKPHGTKDNPFSTYHIKGVNRAFQIPVHWHDELEIIYVKEGSLNVNIAGESYIGNPGDAFAVSPGNLHFMGSQTGGADYYTFLFPMRYVTFIREDILDQEVLEPLNNGRLMIYSGQCHKWQKYNRKGNDILYTAKLHRENIPERIWCPVSPFRKVYIQIFQGALSYNPVTVRKSSAAGTCQTIAAGDSSSHNRSRNAKRLPECELLHKELQKDI